MVDAEQLNLLAIFHFVGAGLAVLGLLFLGAHFLMFMTFMANAPNPQGKVMSPVAFFAMFRFVYAIMAAFCVGSAVMNLLSGLFLRARTHRMYSLIVSGLNCIYVPLGTILGTFTIIVLMRESVCELYDAQRNPYSAEHLERA